MYFMEMHNRFPLLLRRVCQTVVSPAYAHSEEVVFDIGDTCSRMVFVDNGIVSYRRVPRSVCVSNDGDDSDPGGMPVRRTWRMSPVMYESSSSTSTVEDARGSVCEKGSWFSEGALWTEWVNHGRLVALRPSHFLVLEASDYANVLLQSKEAYVATVLYALDFLEGLKNNQCLSD